MEAFKLILFSIYCLVRLHPPSVGGQEIAYISTGTEDLQSSTSVDAQLLREISTVTNVMPLVTKADLHTSEQLLQTQQFVTLALRSTNIRYFDLESLIPGQHSEDGSRPIFAVSSAPLRDDENMDASLLMSSAYVQPLEPSQLPAIISIVFDPNTAAFLRHSALRKFLAWRKTVATHAPSMSLNTIRPQMKHSRALSTPFLPHLAYGTPNSDGDDGRGADASRHTSARPLLSAAHQSSARSTTEYTVARLADHTHREERLAQVHLARWATDLQRAMSNERARYAALQEAERQRWLEDRLKESTSLNGAVQNDGTLSVPGSKRRSRIAMRDARFDSRDPLGLLEWQDILTRRGLLVARVIGSVGIAGAVVVWAMRAWGWGLDFRLQEMVARPFGGWSWQNE